MDTVKVEDIVRAFKTTLTGKGLKGRKFLESQGITVKSIMRI